MIVLMLRRAKQKIQNGQLEFLTDFKNNLKTFFNIVLDNVLNMSCLTLTKSQVYIAHTKAMENINMMYNEQFARLLGFF